jgi:hypothetical protein
MTLWTWVGNGEIGGWLGRELGDDAGTPRRAVLPLDAWDCMGRWEITPKGYRYRD